MAAKRSLDFGTPRRKRTRIQPTLVLYRGVKPEMKYLTTTITYSAAVAGTYDINGVPQGGAEDNRIGAKIKIWSIEYVLAQASGDPIRVDLLLNNVSGGTISHAYDGAIERNKVTVLDTRFLHSGADENSRGVLIRKKLPFGVVSKYTAALGSSVNHNQMVARITTPSSTTVSGYFRIWYTDV